MPPADAQDALRSHANAIYAASGENQRSGFSDQVRHKPDWAATENG